MLSALHSFIDSEHQPFHDLKTVYCANYEHYMSNSYFNIWSITLLWFIKMEQAYVLSIVTHKRGK